MSQDMPFSPLLADILTAQTTATQNATNRVIENLQDRVRELEATLELVREGVESLYEKPWIPQPHTVINALYPNHGLVQKLAKEREEVPL